MSPEDRPRPESPRFFAEELERALVEQEFGIKKWSVIVPTDLPDASNRKPFALGQIQLLEENVIQVHLSLRGYSCFESVSEKAATTYETLDDLLGAISPMYAQRRVEELMKKLTALHNERENAGSHDMAQDDSIAE
ncbi:hypothetical protein BOTBODRAFT_26913 [Botryobasidium botryosum FD-172 SS1]|uniref:GSKIP domain-containing protein n=1 Tax=Botryobasidium botryosum (strain FD-172 SS1) TaxID=930990 RepID=A0A067MZ75_BOTB1|nr:hypothetical protein BOTBODRAFT_26913 [Botryobasidium botryosum FD-172 SS1]